MRAPTSATMGERIAVATLRDFTSVVAVGQLDLYRASQDRDRGGAGRGVGLRCPIRFGRRRVAPWSRERSSDQQMPTGCGSQASAMVLVAADIDRAKAIVRTMVE